MEKIRNFWATLSSKNKIRSFTLIVLAAIILAVVFVAWLVRLFLFNTLNVIAGMANLEDAPTTEQMIEALSSLFRYNLKNQEKEALLFQELKIAGDYMYLQKMRFGSRVEYEVNCEVDEKTTVVPTFTFQPLLLR